MKKEQRNIIITGATSFIGVELIKQLNVDNRIIAIINPSSSRRNNISINDNVKIKLCNLADIDELDVSDVLLANADTFIIHLGWSSAFDNPRYNIDGQMINLEIFKKVCALAEKVGAKRLLSIGSQAECGLINEKLSYKTEENPLTAYAKVKCLINAEGIKWSKNCGIDFLNPRLLSGYGIYDKERTLIMSALKAAVNNEPISFTPCEQMWDYIYVSDIAYAIRCIMERGIPLIRYTIASGEGRILRSYIEDIAKITGNREILKHIGEKEYAKEQVMYLVGDITKTTEDTGFTPRYSFTEGIKETLKFHYNL